MRFELAPDELLRLGAQDHEPGPRPGAGQEHSRWTDSRQSSRISLNRMSVSAASFAISRKLSAQHLLLSYA